MLHAIVFADYSDADYDAVAERVNRALQAAGLDPLFLTNPLVARQADVNDPDFEVRVFAHGRELAHQPAWCEESGVPVDQCVGCRGQR